MTDSFLSLAISFASLLAKLGFLIWAYAKTGQLAAPCYGVYLLVSRFLIPTFFREESAQIVLQLNAPTAVTISFLLDAVLFCWLVRSLVKTPRPKNGA